LAQADCRAVFGDDFERLAPGGVPVPAELLGTAWREEQEDAIYTEREKRVRFPPVSSLLVYYTQA